MNEPDANAQVTVEQDGRTFSGVGVTAEALHDVMDAHEPAPASESAPASTGTPAAGPTVPEPPQLAKGRARFQALTSERDTEKARADAAEKKAAELEARLSQASTAPASPSAPAQPAPSGPERGASGQLPPAQPTRPEPSEDDIGPGLRYETYGAFVKDMHAWSWEQRQADIQQQVRQGIDGYQQQQAFTAHVESTRVKGRAAYADFDQMLASGPGTFVTMPQQAIRAIYQHPLSEHLQYQVMKDGALAQRLAQLAMTDPYSFAFELAKLAPAAQPATNGRSAPLPPAPMQPVGSGGSTSKPTSAEAENFETYQARRRAERKARR